MKRRHLIMALISLWSSAVLAQQPDCDMYVSERTIPIDFSESNGNLYYVDSRELGIINTTTQSIQYHTPCSAGYHAAPYQVEARGQEIWLATKIGIDYYDGTQWQLITTLSDGSSFQREDQKNLPFRFKDVTMHLLKDSNQDIWGISTTPTGDSSIVSKFINGQFVRMYDFPLIGDSYTRDNSGNIWMITKTYNASISNYDYHGYKYVPSQDSLYSIAALDNRTQMKVSNNGKVLFHSLGYAVSSLEYDGINWDTLPGAGNSFCYDQNNILYSGGINQVYQWNGSTWTSALSTTYHSNGLYFSTNSNDLVLVGSSNYNESPTTIDYYSNMQLMHSYHSSNSDFNPLNQMYGKSLLHANNKVYAYNNDSTIFIIENGQSQAFNVSPYTVASNLSTRDVLHDDHLGNVWVKSNSTTAFSIDIQGGLSARAPFKDLVSNGQHTELIPAFDTFVYTLNSALLPQLIDTTGMNLPADMGAINEVECDPQGRIWWASDKYLIRIDANNTWTQRTIFNIPQITGKPNDIASTLRKGLGGAMILRVYNTQTHARSDVWVYDNQHWTKLYSQIFGQPAQDINGLYWYSDSYIYYPNLGCFDGTRYYRYEDPRFEFSPIESSVSVLAEPNGYLTVQDNYASIERFIPNMSYLKEVGREHTSITFIDNNQNGIYEDSLDYIYPSTNISVSGQYNYIYNSGIFSFIASDTAIATFSLPQFYHLTTDSMSYNLAAHYNDTLYFGIYPDTLFNAIGVFPSIYYGHCNSVTSHSLMISNIGTLPLNSVDLVYQIDSLYSFSQASISPNTIQNNTCTWTLNQLLIPGSLTIINLTLNTPDTSAIGDSISFVLTGTATNCADTSAFEGIVQCSYDPNDKLAFPQGEHRGEYTLMGTDMEYMIQFQNTGNYPAQKVVIRDTLAAELDLSTLRIVSQSHLMTTQINGRVLTFTFDNIMLPDSTHDEPNSHGFVRYHISPISNMPVNTLVDNKAYIYFDYNPAVVTSTTHTYFVANYPPLSVPTIISNNLQIYPVPSQNLVYLQCAQSDDYTWTLSDLLGKTLQVGSFKGEQSSLSRGNLPAGIYFITLSNGVSRWTKKVLFTD